jgi:exonuclease III
MCSLLNAYISPKVFPYFNLLSLAFPLLMGLFVVLTIFWIFLRKKRAFFFIFLSLFFFQPTQRWINYHQPSQEIPTLKIISYNNKSKKSVEDYLNNQHADIVFLQESGTKGESRPNLNLKYVTDYIWLVSIHSKYKILNQGMILDDPDAVGKAQFADIEVDKQVIRLVNMYLEPYSFEKNKIRPNSDMEYNEVKGKFIVKRLLKTYKIHAEQVNVIRDFISKSPYPVIVAGDFNAVPNSYEYYQLSKNMQDAFVKSGTGSATSFHDYKFPIRIDYIFSSKTIKPLSYRVDREIHTSDHFPVIATFKILK